MRYYWAEMIWRAVRHTMFSELTATLLLGLLGVLLSVFGVAIPNGVWAVLGLVLLVVVYQWRYGRR
jgi:prepilin signal peptidase PulO-like enzyme (type II secretory pathway)